jgi:hypothetical protein
MKGRRHPSPGKSPAEGKETYVPPREEPGTSEEIVTQGDVYYATEQIPKWPKADSARQYISTPEWSQDIQHGVVTWSEAANSNPEEDDIERRDEPGHKKMSLKRPEHEL